MNNYYNYGFHQITSLNDSKKNIIENSNPSIGYERGNLFDNLYEPYKNYKVIEINPKNEKEYLMYQIQMYSFALNDLNLYLDVFPNDNEMINLRSKFLKEYQNVFNQYETKYQTLGVNSTSLDKAPWGWDTSFPWEVNN